MDSEKEKNIQAAAALSVDTLGKDILEALLTEVRNVPNSWAQLGAIEQENLIDRLRLRVQVMLREAVSIMFGGETPAVRGKLASLKFGKGIQCVVSIAGDASGRHELMDNVGQPVVIIMADPDQYLAAMETVKARAAQRDLFGSTEELDAVESEDTDVWPGKPVFALKPETDGDYVDQLYWLGVDMRAPIWSKTPEEIRSIARAFVIEAHGASATYVRRIPDALTLYRRPHWIGIDMTADDEPVPSAAPAS